MTPLFLAAMAARASDRGYRGRLARLRADLAALDPAQCYVSFSAGKDSAVLAHAAHAVHPGLPIWMIDPGCPTHWLESERAAWLAYAERRGWPLTLFPWDKWGEDRGGGSAAQYRARIHARMFAAIEERATLEGRTVRLLGMRAEESRQRKLLVATRGTDYQVKDGARVVLPLARWTTDDVWTYIVSTGMPWLRIYDAGGPAARNGLIGRNGERYGRAEYLREHFPDAWRWARQRGLI